MDSRSRQWAEYGVIRAQYAAAAIHGPSRMRRERSKVPAKPAMPMAEHLN